MPKTTVFSRLIEHLANMDFDTEVLIIPTGTVNGIIELSYDVDDDQTEVTFTQENLRDLLTLTIIESAPIYRVKNGTKYRSINDKTDVVFKKESEHTWHTARE